MKIPTDPESPAPRRGAGADGTSSLANTAYEKLKLDILSAELEPGAKLRVEFVCERYGMGSSPVREALTRLASEGFVRREENRGFFVADVSGDELRELTDTRCWVEELALRRSIAFGGEAWEERLVVAFHRLTRVPRPPAGTPFSPSNEWVRRHNAFHDALISGCGSRWLTEFCSRLRDQAFRHRRITSEERTGTALAEHEEIMRAALDHDADRAVDLLVRHYRSTAEIALRRLGSPKAEETPPSR